MEKHNTDDLFKKMLEHPPPMKPDMAALEDMNRRLDEAEAAKQNRKGVFFWWLFPLLLLPFLLGTCFFYIKYQTAQKTINELNLQLTDSSIDTINQTIVIQQFDTIFNTIYQDVIVQRIQDKPAAILAANSTTFGASFLPNSGNNYFNSVIADVFNTFVKISSHPSQSDLVRNGKAVSLSTMGSMLEETKGTNSSIAANNWSTIEPIPSLSLLGERFNKAQLLPLSDHFFALSAKNNENINPLWYFIPTGFQAGINWNPISRINLPGSNNNAKTIGLTGEIEFTKNTRLQFGIDYLNVPLKAESIETLNQFPSMMPNDPADILNELYGNFKYLQIPITLKYVFQPNKKWKPSIGIGMIARLPIKEQLKYEYISAQTGEYSLFQELPASGFTTKNWRASIGLEYRLYKQISIQGEGFYNHEFGTSTNPYFKLRYGGLNIGLKYKF